MCAKKQRHLWAWQRKNMKSMTCLVVYHDGTKVCECGEEVTVAIGHRGALPTIFRCAKHAQEFLTTTTPDRFDVWYADERQAWEVVEAERTATSRAATQEPHG